MVILTGSFDSWGIIKAVDFLVLYIWRVLTGHAEAVVCSVII